MFKGLTAMIAYAGNEDRLIRGETIFNFEPTVDWMDLPEDMIPISAGERLISPEELNDDLAKKLGFDTDGTPLNKRKKNIKKYYDKTLKYYGVNDEAWWRHTCALSGLDCRNFSTQELFKRFDPVNDKPEQWRENYVKTILDLHSEIGELCNAEETKYMFEGGLCLILDVVSSPLEIGNWLEKQLYCACFNHMPHDLQIVENDKHKILIAEYDAESG